MGIKYYTGVKKGSTGDISLEETFQDHFFSKQLKKTVMIILNDNKTK